MKIYRILSILLISFATVHVFAGNEGESEAASTGTKASVLKLVVVDAHSGEYLPGVSIKIDGMDKTYYTDLNGEFSFIGIEPGEYDITCNYISYQTTTRENIKVEKNELKEINLALANIR